MNGLKQFVIILAWSLTANSVIAQAQEASLSGKLLSLPVVVVGDAFYSVELSLVAGSDPVELELTSGEEISATSTEGAATLLGSILSIPLVRVAEQSYWVELILVNDNPVRFRLNDAGIITPTNGSDEPATDAFELFESTIAQNIIQSRCVVCHVEGGVARDSDLIYQPSSADSTQLNFIELQSFVADVEDAPAYILSKASGSDHEGGIQLPVGGADYNKLQAFLSALTGSDNLGVPISSPNDFFGAIALQSPAATLRRAAIMVAGRLPTDAEIAVVMAGDEAQLRGALRTLMQGEGFHKFLLNAANDRLLLRGTVGGFLDDCRLCFPAYNNKIFDLAVVDVYEGNPEPGNTYQTRLQHVLRESPLELIAYVVENEFPYSEILTADYMMMTPLLDDAFGGTAVFNDRSAILEYQPGQIKEMYLYRGLAIEETVEGISIGRITYPGPGPVDYPHAGVLNSMAFLLRYPTTATNRNRARARWTYLHFLDVDIERSAQRTTDPVALADTNNPTLNNSKCTVCHERLDPVAGAYQNYYAGGQYKIHGDNSLDDFYINPLEGETLYRGGDVWYRDMREPGLDLVPAPSTDNSVQWLAQQIVAKSGFASATVNFWWPAVIGSELLFEPEVAEDLDYPAQLAAYDAQRETVLSLAAGFTDSGMNLKDLLVEMLMSPWFRTESVNSYNASDTVLAAHRIAKLGNEKLLTAEQLKRKTTAVTGYTWKQYWHYVRERKYSGLGYVFRLYYGGIDSSIVIKRGREMTSLMSTIPMLHALESACPIVLREFALPDDERKLFAGIDEFTTPENGARTIKEKLVDLHKRMLGKDYDVGAPEILSSYSLFVESWTRRQQEGVEGNLFSDKEIGTCSYQKDIDFGEGLGFPGEAQILELRDNGTPYYRINEEFEDFVQQLGDDPLNIKQSWIVVIVYLMTHYDYLYE